MICRLGFVKIDKNILLCFLLYTKWEGGIKDLKVEFGEMAREPDCDGDHRGIPHRLNYLCAYAIMFINAYFYLGRVIKIHRKGRREVTGCACAIMFANAYLFLGRVIKIHCKGRREETGGACAIMFINAYLSSGV